MNSTATVTVDRPDMGDTDRLIELWIALVHDQHQYGTALLADENEDVARERFAFLRTIDGIRVARVAGEVVGFVTFERRLDAFKYSASFGVIQNLFVEESMRDRGIGTRLLDAAETVLRDRGAERIRLEVLIHNERARSFYVDRGYDPQRITLEKVPQTDTHNGSDP